MIKTFSKQVGSTHVIIILILVVALIAALGLIFWNSLKQSRTNNSTDNPTSIIKGTITAKRTSCGEEILGDNGQPKRVAGICDAGNSIVVNDVRISTGGGALTSDPPEYITSIGSLHAGDVVEVKYVKNKEGYSSTNCESCYIKKEGSSEKEPQEKRIDN